MAGDAPGLAMPTDQDTGAGGGDAAGSPSAGAGAVAGVAGPAGPASQAAPSRSARGDCAADGTAAPAAGLSAGRAACTCGLGASTAGCAKPGTGAAACTCGLVASASHVAGTVAGEAALAPAAAPPPAAPSPSNPGAIPASMCFDPLWWMALPERATAMASSTALGARVPSAPSLALACSHRGEQNSAAGAVGEVATGTAEETCLAAGGSAMATSSGLDWASLCRTPMSECEGKAAKAARIAASNWPGQASADGRLPFCGPATSAAAAFCGGSGRCSGGAGDAAGPGFGPASRPATAALHSGGEPGAGQPAATCGGALPGSATAAGLARAGGHPDCCEKSQGVPKPKPLAASRGSAAARPGDSIDCGFSPAPRSTLATRERRGCCCCRRFSDLSRRCAPSPPKPSISLPTLSKRLSPRVSERPLLSGPSRLSSSSSRARTSAAAFQGAVRPAGRPLASPLALPSGQTVPAASVSGSSCSV
mmetsp:Transcript_109889/g.354796  ORF Transcript_109889/g.354796 Transcript_109889/m.354796 type:complete len:480 (-) Transcript_109889:135-1574(-)